MHIHVSLFDVHIFFIILKMTLRNHAGKQTTAHLQRKDAGWCGGLTHRTDAEGSYGRRPNRRATSPSAIQNPRSFASLGDHQPHFDGSKAL